MIDFHCHLDLYPSPRDVVERCVDLGIYVLSVTTTPSAWAGTAELTGDAPRIRTALGLHPELAHERKRELALFEKLLPSTRYVGEVGLDGSPRVRTHWRDQLFVFERVLTACAAAGGRVLSVHSRRAAPAVLDALERAPGAGTAVLHWFSGSPRDLARAVSLDCWFSVGPAMLASERGRALAASMPRDRVLTESDGPFAQLDGRSASPEDAEVAVDGLSALWGQARADTEAVLRSNLRRLVSE